MTQPARPIEHRAEPETFWLIPSAGGSVERRDGVSIRWRFKGERRWRRYLIDPVNEQGQTVESLMASAAAIAAELARRES